MADCLLARASALVYVGHSEAGAENILNVFGDSIKIIRGFCMAKPQNYFTKTAQAMFSKHQHNEALKILLTFRYAEASPRRNAHSAYCV